MPPAAAGEEEEKEARAPRAPAGAHHPPDGVCVPLHPLLNSYYSEYKKAPVSHGALALTLVPLILRNTPPELAPYLQVQMGCRASSGRFPPPLLMRASLIVHIQLYMLWATAKVAPLWLSIPKYAQECQGIAKGTRDARSDKLPLRARLPGIQVSILLGGQGINMDSHRSKLETRNFFIQFSR